MTDQEYVKSLYEKGKMAMEEIEDYSQKQIDKMLIAIGKVVYDVKEELAAMGAEETKMGDPNYKILKHRTIPMTLYYMKGKKSTGVIDYDSEKQIAKVAKPAGVIAAIQPSTNQLQVHA